MVMKMLTKLRRRMEELSGNFDKDTENIKRTKQNWKITEIKKTLEGPKSRPEDEEWISHLENWVVEIIR